MGKSRRCLVVIMVTLALLMPGLALIPTASASSITKNVTFSSVDPTGMVTLSSSVYVTYDESVEIFHDEDPSITYSVQPGELVLTLWLKLSDLPFGLEDETIRVPITNTQLLNQAVSLTQYLTSVPAALASIDMMIRTKVSIDPLSTSSSLCSIVSQPPSMTWSQWGSKAFIIDSSSDGWVRTCLNYQITVGVVASVLSFLTDSLTVTLIPDVVVTSTAGDNPLITTVYVRSDGSSILSSENLPVVVGLLLIAAVAVVVILALVLTRRNAKRAPPMMSSPPATSIQNQLKFCSNCGKRMSKGASFCPQCGGKQR